MYIYVITNLVNGKIYVGQHAGNDLQAYFRHNIRQALNGLGNKLYLYRAIRKYGPENFTISLIAAPIDKEQMDKMEIFFIKALDTRNDEIGYNITAGGGGRLGIHRPHTEEEKIKIGLAHKNKPKSPEWAKKIGDSQRGRKFTVEHIAALRAGQKGKKKYRSPEHCEKIRQHKKAWWAKKKLEAK